MAEATNTPNAEEIEQTGAADPSGKATEPKTFTQEQVNRMIQERLARAKSEPPADYDELKAKAAKLDELEEEQKSELERITDTATKAQTEAAEWKSKYDELQAQRQHELDVRNAASAYGIDADVLMRMGGDVEENAKFLQAKEAARPKFGSMNDGGEQKPPTVTESDIDSIKDPVKRIRARAEYLQKNNLVK